MALVRHSHHSEHPNVGFSGEQQDLESGSNTVASADAWEKWQDADPNQQPRFSHATPWFDPEASSEEWSHTQGAKSEEPVTIQGATRAGDMISDTPPQSFGSEIITEQDASHFVDQVTRWWSGRENAEPISPTDIVGEVDTPAEAVPMDDSPKMNNVRSLDERRSQRRPPEVYRFKNENGTLTQVGRFAGEDTTQEEEDNRWKQYTDTPFEKSSLPRDEELVHERLTKWFERTQTSFEAKMRSVAQYLKENAELLAPEISDIYQLRTRLTNTLKGCGELLYSLKEFGFKSSIATYNIMTESKQKLHSLSERLEPQQHRRVIAGFALGVVAVGAATYASRRGFDVADIVGGNEDQALPRRGRIGLPIDIQTETTPPQAPAPHSNGLGIVQDALDQNPGEVASVETPKGTYAYPWDWASETFGSDNATPRLHELAERAAKDGHKVTWHNAGSAQEWLQIDNSSASDYVIETLNQYVA